jgi:hypothetical protein
MSGPYRHEWWICERCEVQGRFEAQAREHYEHPAGWKPDGNQHPEIDKWSPDHPDREEGFYWTADWRPLALEAAHRYAEGHKRRRYWLERAAQLPLLRSETVAFPGRRQKADSP